MIQGVEVTRLKSVEVPGGNVLHAFKKSEKGFIDFGEAYFSLVAPGAIKAWKKHKEMTLNLVCPIGKVKFVLLDEERDGTHFEEYILSTEDYFRLTIPPNIWFGFQGQSGNDSLILNIADLEHNTKEVERKSLDKIIYRW